MAGPRFLATGGVVDPYAGLQNAVSQVGDIYQNYAENERREAEFKAQEDERNRVKSVREFAASYDTRVGDDYRGISAGMRPLVEQIETQTRQRWQAANPNATAEQVSAFDKELLGARRSLVSSEDVAAIVTDDLVRAGVPYQDAIARGQLEASKYSPRGAALAQAQAEADARNKAADAMSERLLKMHDIQSRGDAAAMRAVGGSSYGSGGSRTGSTVKSGTGGGALLSPKTETELREFVSGRIGGWPFDVDTPAAMQNFKAGLDSYNRKAVAAGGRPLSFPEAQSLVISSIDESNPDADVKFQTPEEFETLLTDQNGAPGTTKTQSTGGGSGSSSDRQALIAGMRSKLSAAEREAILSPSRAIVDPQQVMRQQVASAYASMFPQAAQENRAVVERALSPAPSPSRSTAAPTSTVSAGGVRPRYEVKPPAPLAEGQTRGTGRVELPVNKPQVAPADVSSSSNDRTSETPINRDLAQNFYAYAESGQPNENIERQLQRLNLQNPERYNELIEARQNLRTVQNRIQETDSGISDVNQFINLLEESTTGVDPETLSTKRGFLGRRSPYESYLKTQTDLQRYRESLARLQKERSDLGTRAVGNQAPDLTKLQSLLSNM